MKQTNDEAMRKFFYLLVTFILVGCGGGGGDGGSGSTVPVTNPEAVTSIAPQAGSPVYSGFDLKLKQGDWWLYNWKDVYILSIPSIIPGNPDSTTTTTMTGTARITLGSPKTFLGITFFQVIAQYTGDVPTSFYIDWQYLASFDNKVYGCKDDQVFLIFDAHNGGWVGGTFFGGTTVDWVKTRTLSLTAYKDMFGVVTPGMYYARYPESGIGFTREEYFTQGVGPSGYYEWHLSNGTGGLSGSQSRWTQTFTLAGSSR